MLRHTHFLKVYRDADTGAGGGGTAGTGTAGEGGTAGTGSTGDAGTGEQGVPQAKVNEIAARERAQGERATAAAVAEQLGMSVEEAKKFIADAKTKERETLAEGDRKLAEAADREAAATKREEAAAAREHAADLRAALIEAGVPRTKAERASRLVDSKPGDDAKTITDAVEALKPDWPELFAAAEGEEGGENGTGENKGAKKTGATSGSAKGGNGGSRKDAKPEDALARGAERARQAMEKRGVKVPAAAGSQT